jgi:hypothetical protein
MDWWADGGRMVGGRWLALIYNSINSHTISSSDIGIDSLVDDVLLIILITPYDPRSWAHLRE